MVPALCKGTVPVPLPAYHRSQLKRRPTLHLDALTLVTRLHLLSLLRLAVHLAQHRCPPPLHDEVFDVALVDALQAALEAEQSA